MNKYKIDNEVLIQAIRAQPQLWDSRLKSYSHKSKKQISWQEVADDVGSTVQDCKTRWKTLRDSFIRQLRNLRRQGVTDDLLTSQWVHFDDMLFLKDVCTTHGTTNKSMVFSHDESNDSETKSHSSSSQMNSMQYSSKIKQEREYNDDEEDGSCDDNDDDQINELSPIIRKRIKLTPPKVIQITSDPLKISTGDLEKKKIEILQKDCTNSPDYHFLMSLLPTLERIPKEKKMLIKVQMLSMLYEATFDKKMPSDNLNQELKNSSMRRL